ncbi:MAG TPA: transcription termination factor Rho [Amycolatopsis sp.]|uniref:transcription termination factor Rho, short form n=1 Tax=Amycolatopsis sp. TaxID=37632 RepID=UPI002B483ED2|nr:transcription termination factor Rho [Amycolatopsis sp.]HKS48956.1 transcription termination factor Rho [Amycolatopsis sp.]
MYSNDTPHEPHQNDSQLPVAGVFDTLDNRSFVRVNGYLAMPHDVYVPPALVRTHGLRRGDTITGRAHPAGNGHKRPSLAQVDTINGQHPQRAAARPAFSELVPVYPRERLRLETEPHALTTRVIDLLMPVGKGQRALIVAPPKAGKTSVLHAVAQGISKNHPECHLMLVLVGERPEEVTDFARAVPGEVIAATFDHPPGEHTALAELAIERAKRLVEMGRDVVVLLDSLTRLGRAYNLAAPASGRILSGGIDSTALIPPKRFLGAARAIENGGSLTIFATTLVDTGSAGDTLIFEEYKGTSNAELTLDRTIATKRVYPAVDVSRTSTRKEELLCSPAELAATRALRRALHRRESHQAIDMLLDGLRTTPTNVEFLTQIINTTSRDGGNSGAAGR